MKGVQQRFAAKPPHPRGGTGVVKHPDGVRWQKAQAVRRSCLVEIAVLLTIISGCDVLSRPTPSREEYLARYMKHFDDRQIERIDYVYEGAVGGERTAARVQFKGPVKVYGGTDVGKYDPNAVNEEPAASEFRRQWEFSAGGKLPSWFDFPFDQDMRMLRESRETPSDGRPTYNYEWYIDDQRNVVYFQGVKG